MIEEYKNRVSHMRAPNHNDLRVTVWRSTLFIFVFLLIPFVFNEENKTTSYARRKRKENCQDGSWAELALSIKYLSQTIKSDIFVLFCSLSESYLAL